MEEPVKKLSGAGQSNIETKKATVIAGGHFDLDNISFDRNGRSGIRIEEQNTAKYLRETLRKTVEFEGTSTTVRNRTISGHY